MILLLELFCQTHEWETPREPAITVEGPEVRGDPRAGTTMINMNIFQQYLFSNIENDHFMIYHSRIPLMEDHLCRASTS